MSGKLRRAGTVGLIAGLAGVTLSVVPWVLELDQSAGLGLLFRLRGPIPAPNEVAVVAISGAAADRLGLPSQLNEWPRDLHAALIDRLASAGVKAIAIDILFERPRGEPDRVLARSIAAAGNVILAEGVRSEELDPGTGAPHVVVDRRIEPLPELGSAALGTAPFTLPRVPISVSQFWAFGRGMSEQPNLPIVAFQAHALDVYDALVALVAEEVDDDIGRLPGLDRVRVEHGLGSVVRALRGLFLDDRALANRLRARIAAAGFSPERERTLFGLVDAYAGPDSRYLNYYGPPRSIPTIPYDALLGPNAEATARALAGRTVFVGYSEPRRSERQQDEFYSVYSSQASGISLSGVEIGATAFANLLEGNSITLLPMPSYLAAMFGWSFVLATTLFGRAARWVLLGALSLGALYFGVAWWTFEAANLWLPVVAPLGVILPLGMFAMLLVRHRELGRQRHRIQAALGHYVPPSVVARLAHESFAPGASAELVHGTCLITDAEQFTRLAESLDPEALHALVREYFAVLSAVVRRRGGFIADISGDSMVATWAAARPDADLRRQACLAALEVLDEVAEFNANRGPRTLPTGIGLDSGKLLLGNIGGAERLQYRAVGDIVNTASRIQGLNRQLGTHALLSASTLESLADVAGRKVGDFLLVGKTQATEVYELFGLGEDARAQYRERAARFEAALALFAAREWTRAKRAFEALLEDIPGDGPSRFYRRQCETFAELTLADDWRGTIRMTVK